MDMLPNKCEDFQQRTCLFKTEQVLKTGYIHSRIRNPHNSRMKPNQDYMTCRKLNSPNKDGETLLIEAILSDNIRVLHQLLAAGADPNIPDGIWKWPPLFYAAYENKACIMRILIDHGADIHRIDHTGSSALHIAAKGNAPDCIQMLIDHGACVNQCDRLSGHTPLYYALWSEHYRCQALLLANGADLWYRRNFNALTVVLTADTMFCQISIDLLISHGMDINAPILITNDTYTPLMYASGMCCLKTVCHLLQRNADITFRNNRGHSALTISLKGMSEDTDNRMDVLYAAGGMPPSNGFLEQYLPHFLDRTPVPELRQLCRKTIRTHLLKVNPPGNLFTHVPMLGLPYLLQSYLMHGITLDGFA